MRLWRVSRTREIRSPGAKGRGARWNRPGTEVIYAAASLALATLELFVHVDQHATPHEMTAHLIDIPDDVKVERVDAAKLPDGWDRYPGPSELQDIGTAWVERGETLLLAVPTAVLRVSRGLITTEVNYLIDPAHPDFARVRVRTESYRLDPRIWK